MKFGRRPQFFALISAVSFFMIIVTPSEFHGVNYFCGGLAAFWAVVLGIEELAAQRRTRQRDRDDAAKEGE